MKWNPTPAVLPMLALGAALAPVCARAAIFVSVEQAQREMFGATPLKPFPVALTPQQQDKLKEASSVSLPFQGNRVWKAADGGWFVVDEVVGKHEFITYAVGINPNGSVKRVEVLEYHESYGFEVADAKWLNQFVGKGSESTLKLGKDVENISGATLSSKHLTDGVKRVMTMYALLLQHA
jgi:hypothetical protein